MTLKVSSNEVNTVEGVPISVTGIAQVAFTPSPQSSLLFVLHPF